jgi:CO/xanthine dehydrogenase FAD-binding subunit
MKPFHYVRPDTLADALVLLETHGPAAKVLAGGTDLLVQMRARRVTPDVVVDIKHIEELAPHITVTDRHIRIGARVTMTQIIRDPRIQRLFPALVESARVVGSAQIRSRATLAGNLANASPAADTAPALLVAGAVLNLAGSGAARSVPVASFLAGPGRTQLGRSELVTSIDIPLPASPSGASFLRLTRRKGIDLASVSVSCLIDGSGRIRVACGAVAAVPFVIEGGDRRTLVDEALSHASPISDLRASREYRIAMMRVFIVRAIRIAQERLANAPRGAR